ncbi:MAG: hypothetical protein M1840_008503 [Geoglossum simile]|nr:MAG: hypothetical protein M1840_008503 [Geoglossum simile]
MTTNPHTSRRSEPARKKRRVGLSHQNRGKRFDEEVPGFRDLESPVEQAEQYRLGTVRMPIDSLSSVWRRGNGTNRQVSHPHVLTLLKIFLDEGLKRKAPENHLLVGCNGSQVGAMLQFLESRSTSSAVRANTRPEIEKAMRSRFPRNQLDEAPEWPLFEGWEKINGRAELMAGQHRVEALKLYIQATSSDITGQSWWVCDLYDLESLPEHLNIKLRANRRDAKLPDSHGQVWMELHQLSETDCSLFQGGTNLMQRQMLESLGLGGSAKFPIRRLTTLWRNNNWKSMITRWCSMAVGRETFNVSSWDEMMRYRIDEFWFEKFNNILDILHILGGAAAHQISPHDWESLVGLQFPRDESEVREWFYPNFGGDIPPGASSRRSGFLTALEDETYQRAHDYVVASQDLLFEDLGQLFKRCRQEGRMISSVMTHVCRWLNSKPSRVGDRDNNKPPLWSEFLPAMRNRYGDAASIESMTLQKDIIDFVLQRYKDFDNTAISYYLQQLPDGEEDTNYNERFTTQVWKDLLVMVRGRVGPNLKNRCLVSFNSEDPTTILSKPISAITQVMCSAITGLPEVMDNPALNTQQASDELFARIQPEVMRIQSVKTSNHWPPVKLEFVKAERSKFSHILKIIGTASLNPEPEDPGLVGNPPVQIVVDKANLIGAKMGPEVTPTVTPESSPMQAPVRNIQIGDEDHTFIIPRRVLRTPSSGGSGSLSPQICDSDYDGNLGNESQPRGLSRVRKKPPRSSSTLALSATLSEPGNPSSSGRQLDQDLGVETIRNVSTKGSDKELSGIVEKDVYSLPSSNDDRPTPRVRQLGRQSGDRVFGGPSRRQQKGVGIKKYL